VKWRIRAQAVRSSFILAAACVLLASLGSLAVAQSPALGGRPTTLSGKSAFGDWRMDAPLVRRKIDLPAPHATRSAFNFSRIVPKPASAARKVPPGFRADLVISALQIAVAPAGSSSAQLQTRLGRPAACA